MSLTGGVGDVASGALTGGRVGLLVLPLLLIFLVFLLGVAVGVGVGAGAGLLELARPHAARAITKKAAAICSLVGVGRIMAWFPIIIGFCYDY